MVALTTYVGDFGRWQCYIFVVCALTGFGGTMQIYVMTFYTPNVDYWCARPESLRDQVPVKEWRNYSSPMVVVEGKSKRSSCEVYDTDYKDMNESDLVSISHNETRECHKWEFDTGIFKRTMIEEFHLVCSRDILISTCNAVYMAAFMVSVLINGHLADRFGRRKLFLVCGFFLVAFSFAMAFSNTFIMFLVLRTFQCYCGMGISAISYTLFAETISKKYRAILGNLFFYGFTFGTMTFTGIAYELLYWVHIQFVIAGLCVLLLILFWFLPESPKWLLMQERYHDAALEIERAMRWNRREPIELKVLEEELKKSHTADMKNNEALADTHHYSVLDLMKSPNMRIKTLVLFLCWPVNAFVYYGLSFNTNDLGGNPFVNFLISAAVEIPAYILAAVLTSFVGRRIPLMVLMVIAGLACASTIIIPKAMLTLQIVFPMLGKLCISATFGMVYVYSSEIFPTVVRGIGIGACSMVGRVGSILAPYVRELGRHTHVYVPPAIYGALAVVSGLLVLFLPETKGNVIPDTLEEAEKISRRKIVKEKEKEIEMQERL